MVGSAFAEAMEHHPDNPDRLNREPEVTITSAQVYAENGTLAAIIEYVPVGGGTQTVTVDGVPEERIHPFSATYHVRFISPDRMVADELRDTDSYEEACALAIKYAAKLNEHATRVAELADDLKV